ncbi:hypothetical protein [Sphingopyxis sp.]|uniref:hypothetical protein n=1 Tax=Sphingopyxis sp. TaxID=1908224 RepID=UPI002ED7E43F
MRLPVFAALLLMPLGAAAQFVPRTSPGSDWAPGMSDMGTLPGGPTFGHDLLETRERIDRGRADGELSKPEARALRREARQISSLAERYGRDGLSASEQRELDMRVRALQGLAAAQRAAKPP